jgi:hypothetical protein
MNESMTLIETISQARYFQWGAGALGSLLLAKSGFLSSREYLNIILRLARDCAAISHYQILSVGLSLRQSFVL